MMKTVIMAAAILAGCSGMQTITQERQQVSSAHIGCAPEEIGIVNTGRSTWEASCKTRMFYCTVSPDSSCAEKM